MQGPPGDDAFFDTAGCFPGDIIAFTGSVLECVPPGAVISRRTVFTTSAVFTGDLATAGIGVDGLDGADNLCQAAAAAVGAIVPAGVYVALLSTSTVDARDRLTPNGLGYVLPDGKSIIAISKADLFDGDISFRIDQDEEGNTISDPTRVWTGSLQDGTVATFISNQSVLERTCEAWTSSTNDFEGGQAGKNSVTNFEWLSNQANLCKSPHRLYCFQQ